MLTGDGAQRFARVMGFPDHDPVTPERRADWFDKRNRIDEVLGEHALKMRRFLKDHPEYAGGTVGAAAVDGAGRARRGDLHRRRDAEDGRPRGRLARPRGGQLRLAAHRRLGHRHRRVRAALARHARDLRAGRAGREPRRRRGCRARAGWARTSTPTSGSSRSTGWARRWPCTARATCRTPSSRARRRGRPDAGLTDGEGLQDPGLDARRDLHAAARRAAPRAGRPPRLLAERHRQPGPRRDPRCRRPSARSARKPGIDATRPRAARLERVQRLRDLSPSGATATRRASRTTPSTCSACACPGAST